MKVLMLSESGDGLGIAQRIAMEGHTIDVWIKDTQYKDSGVGIVGRVDSWRPYVPKADLVIGDMVGFGKYEDVIRTLGKPSLGISMIADMMELDRTKAMELLQRSGIKVPQEDSFKSPKDALAIVQDFPSGGVVLKPCGNKSTAKTVICRDKEICRFVLESYDDVDEVLVQQIVEGVEISTEGWFNGRDWIYPFNHTFEEKRLFNDDKGANTGCMGNVVFAPRVLNRVIMEGIYKLTPFLKKIGFKGPIDLNTIVNEAGVWALELTPRFGYDAIEALMEGLRGDITDLLFETSMGIASSMDVTEDFMGAVRVSVKPWPHAKPDDYLKGLPIIGVNEQNLRHIYFSDAYYDGEDAEYKYAAGDGVVYKATAHGRSVKETMQRIYRTIENVQVLDAQYRTDIGTRVDSDMARLKDFGYDLTTVQNLNAD